MASVADSALEDPTTDKRETLIRHIYSFTSVLLLLTFVGIPYYPSFYVVHFKPYGPLWVWLLLAVAFSALTDAVRSKRITGKWFLLVAMLASAVLQFGFAFTEGRGIDGMRDRAVKTGHAEFVHIAIAFNDIAQVMKNYESLATHGKLGKYAQSKPPGQLLVYILTRRFTDAIYGAASDEATEAGHVQTVICWLWPLLATLAALPLYGVAMRLTGEVAKARAAVALFFLTPSVNLVMLHTDQMLFPFLFLSCLYLFLIAYAQRGRPLFVVAGGLLTGIAVYAAAFFQMPVAIVTVFFLGAGWSGFFSQPKRERKAWLLFFCLLGLALIDGILLATSFMSHWIGYDPLLRLQHIKVFHEQWRHVPPMVGLFRLGVNIVEFADWIGMPIAVLAVASLQLGVKRAHWSDPFSGLSFALLFCLIYFGMFSGTVAEIARLWIFLIPIVCLMAARMLVPLGQSNRHIAWAVYALQFATVYLIKIRHDFF